MGLVYYYAATARNGQSWSALQEIRPVGGNSYDYFGSSVALYHKNKAAIGAWGSDLAAGGGGVVYTYRMVNSQWSQYGRLVSPDPADFEWYGGCLSINQHYLAVGAIGNSVGGAMAGAVYVYSDFDSYSWALQKKLYGEASDNFGKSVAVHGDLLAVGAPGAFRRPGTSTDFYAQRTGRVSLYRAKSYSTWQLEEGVICTDCDVNDAFGTSVDVNSNSGTVVVGKKQGAYVYQYDKNSAAGYKWADQTVITPPEELVQQDNNYGISVAVTETSAFVGSRDEVGLGGTQSGMAFAFIGFVSAYDYSLDALLRDEITVYEVLYSVIALGIMVLILLPVIIISQVIHDSFKRDDREADQRDHKPLIK
jgi:hypothetical protein